MDDLSELQIIVAMLEEMVERIARKRAGNGLSRHPASEKPKVDAVKQEIKRRAAARLFEPIAYSLEIRQRDDGLTEVRIDRGRKIVLKETLAKLLAILVSDRGEDGFVEWKSRDEIARLLGAQLQRSFKPHAVTVNVSRLRDELTKGDANRWLIQNDRTRGYRFALRSEPSEMLNGPVRAHWR